MKDEIISYIVKGIILILAGVITTYLIPWLKEKANGLKANIKNETLARTLDLVVNLVDKAVTATNQTFVQDLKDRNSFDKQAQQEAFNKTFEAIKAMLSEEVKGYLQESIGDIDTYLTQLIENAVSKNK